MKTDSLKRLAILGLSSEQMSVVLDVLAVELAPMERTRELAAQRQQRYVERNTNVRLTSLTQRQDNVISEPSRVIDNTSSFLTSGEEKKEESKSPLSAPPSKPAFVEPKGFSEFIEIYPPRAGGNDRRPAAKGFTAALRRAGSLEVLLDGTRRYRAHCDTNGNTGTQYVLKPRKWLNDHGWENTYETARTNHKHNTIAGGFDIIDRAIEERFGSGEADTEHISRLLKIAS